MQALGGMRMVSIEQFGEGIGQMILSGHLGRQFDRVSRKFAILTVVPVNNISITLGASAFIVCMSVQPYSVWFTSFLILGIAACAVNRLFLNAEKSLLSRDWLVVISSGGTLSSLNAAFTALDQLTNVISPIIVGVWIMFYMKLLFHRFTIMISSPIWRKMVAVVTSTSHVLQTYGRQSVVAAAFGMALLFMTAMGFDGVRNNDAFLHPMGILGALSYALFERRFGVRKTGLLGLTCQQFCLIAAVISIWLPGSPFDPKEYFYNETMKVGHVCSRIELRLWMADLSIIHIMQESVPESDRNTVFGVHNALCQTFSILKVQFLLLHSS
ncbi:unnamed protein product [Angiostrongylus costaricensis]|uniref:Solute carrier family 40 member n=1 Tax=Angiostrongylus costaricensis TaxID=334426 RepID=A0A158PF20_ANGCS|nr:unnamed protein product [Angiostrongylus costaricensis]